MMSSNSHDIEIRHGMAGKRERGIFTGPKVDDFGISVYLLRNMSGYIRIEFESSAAQRHLSRGFVDLSKV
jgi:hypothetical protein